MNNSQIKSVTVYCSSSNHVEDIYLTAARKLGQLIAEHGLTLVYGGGNIGLMAAVGTGVREKGGKIVSVILKKFVEMGVADTLVNEIHIVEDMRARKQGLDERGDAYIALPGGFGTFEEVLEVISFKQLGFHNKPIVILNTKGYFEGLLKQFERAFQEKFINSKFRKSYQVVETPEQAIRVIENYEPNVMGQKFTSSSKK